MKIKSVIYTLVGRACAICVGISLLFFTVAQIAAYIRMEGELGISFSQYLLFLLFSFVLSGASYFFRMPLPRAVNLLCHYACCLLSFFITFIAAGKLVTLTPSVVLVFVAIFTVLYALFFGIFLLVRKLLGSSSKSSKIDRKSKAEEEYQSRFQ